MTPISIQSHKFSVHTILYNKGGFMVAYGKWDNGPSRLAMRWDTSDLGFPNHDGQPLWFHLPDNELWSNEMLKALMKIKTVEMEEKVNV